MRLTFRSIPMLAIAAFAASCGAGAGSAAAEGCDRFAGPSGSDRDAGTSTSPYRTPQRLADALAPGETGCLRSGTYAGGGRSGYVVRFNHGGRAGAPITLRSHPEERAVLRGVVVVPKGSDHVVLSDLAVDDPTPYAQDGQIAIQVHAADTTLARLDVTTRNRKTCVLLGSGRVWGKAVRTVIRDSVLHECGDPGNRMLDHAIYAAATRDLRVIGNVVRGTGGWAIHLYPDSRNSVISRNVIVANGGGVIFAGAGRQASSGNLVERNVISGSIRAANIASYWERRVGTGNVARDNCLYNARRNDAAGRGPGYAASGNVIANPDFVSGAMGDYRLASGSPCTPVVGPSAGGLAVTLARQAAARAAANRG